MVDDVHPARVHRVELVDILRYDDRGKKSGGTARPTSTSIHRSVAQMKVAEIWRYPVKTMAGERLERAALGPLGIEGDRIVHVQDAWDHVVTSRSHPRFLGHKGTLGPDREPRVDGRPWSDPGVAADVASIAGAGARLVHHEGADRFDVLPLLVATDGAIAAFGYDRRRLRPNIVIEGVDGLGERDWPGACLRIGQVLIGVQDLRLRCIMTSFDPDTLVQDKEVTRGIYRRFEGKIALDCFVLEAGEIAVGDAVELVRSSRGAGDGPPRTPQARGGPGTAPHVPPSDLAEGRRRG
jgi:uncharacterized protein